MRFDLLLTGPPRSGTTMLWNCLEHPNISKTLRKEPLSSRQNIKFETYIEDNYVLKKHTKVLFDGTAFGTENINDLAKTIKSLSSLKEIKSIKFINLFRSPLDRAKSHAYWALFLYYKGADFFKYYRPQFLSEDGKLIEENFINSVIFHIEQLRKTLEILKENIGKENVLILSLKTFHKNTDELFKFLNLDPIPINIVKMNSSYDAILKIEHIFEKSRIKNKFEEFNTELVLKSLTEINKIAEKFEIKGIK